MSARITIEDVARAARVAPSTVSRALTVETARIGKETRQRIVRIANELGYSPNPIAQGLATGVTNAVGMILPNVRNPFPFELVELIEERIHLMGYQTWLLFCHDNLDLFQNAMNTLLAHRLRGMIISPADFGDTPPPLYTQIMNLKNPSLPVVSLLERFFNHNRFSVTGDNFAGTKLALQHLIDLGHRRIGLLIGALTNSSLLERFEGYQLTLKKNQIPFDENLVCRNVWRADMSYSFQCVQALLHQPHPPTALFICSDFIALPVIRYIKEMGLSIPRDLSVMGFDNIELCDYLAEPLTTVGFPREQMADATVRILADWWGAKGHIDNRDVRIQPQLIVRSSTAPPNA